MAIQHWGVARSCYRFRDCGPDAGQTEQSGATVLLASPSQRTPHFISWPTKCWAWKAGHPRSNFRCAAVRSVVVIWAGHKCEQIDESRLVGIAHRAFAVWQNPFGMLPPEVVMNLLPEVRDCLGYYHNQSPFD